MKTRFSSALLLTGLLFTACGGSTEVPKTLSGDWIATGPGTLGSIRIDAAKKTFAAHGAGTDHSAHGHWNGTISGGGSELSFEGSWDGGKTKETVAATFTDGDAKKLEIAFPKGKQSFTPAK